MRKEHKRLAEVACENYLKSLGCRTRRSVKSKWHKIDFFACDVMGVRRVHDTQHIPENYIERYWIQVTTGEWSAVTQRRRKLEKEIWSDRGYDNIYIFQFRETPNPANRKKKLYHFKVSEYEPNPFDGEWGWSNWDNAIEIPQEWFKANRDRD